MTSTNTLWKPAPVRTAPTAAETFRSERPATLLMPSTYGRGTLALRPGSAPLQICGSAERIARSVSGLLEFGDRATRSSELPKLTSLPEKKIYGVDLVTGWISRAGGGAALDEGCSRIEMELPFGTPRAITAHTLKLLLDAKPAEVLMRRAGTEWVICEDATPIDLLDNGVEFRLGRISIYS
jgi:hypothetical protein